MPTSPNNQTSFTDPATASDPTGLTTDVTSELLGRKIGQLTIGLVAHDRKKDDLIEWARFNRALLEYHTLYATGTTGTLLERDLGLTVEKLKSGPLGGDQQLGAMISEGRIDLLIFFWDPLEPQPHEPDVKALLRIAVVWNVPVACNRATADFLISSPLMSGEYARFLPDYADYLGRQDPSAATDPVVMKIVTSG